MTTKHWTSLWTNLFNKSFKWTDSSDSVLSKELLLTSLAWPHWSLSTKPSKLCFTVAVELWLKFWPSETFTTLPTSVDARQLNRNLYPPRCETACICGCQTRVTSAATWLECFGNAGQMLPAAEWVVVVWDPGSYCPNICLFICFTEEKKQRLLNKRLQLSKLGKTQSIGSPADWIGSCWPTRELSGWFEALFFWKIVQV